MGSPIQSDNPYAPPQEVSNRAMQVTAEDRDFELTENGVLCRSNVTLPQFCLVTGQSGDLRVLTLKVLAPSDGLRTLRCFATGLLLIPLGILLVIYLVVGQNSPQEAIPLYFLLGVWAFVAMLINLALELSTPRVYLKVCLSGEKYRQWKWLQWAVLPAIGLAASSELLKGFFGVIGLCVCWFLVLLILGFLRRHMSKRWLHGANLIATRKSEEHFEVTRFSASFMTALREHVISSRNDPLASQNL
ncbi:MAG: hypothetical protein U0936_25910 [Planctomycetaceae bacterium]